MNEFRGAIMSVLAMLLVLGFLVVMAVRASDQHKRDCEAKGGVYFQARGGRICLRPEAVIK